MRDRVLSKADIVCPPARHLSLVALRAIAFAVGTQQ
jgi:hypothetical protein